MKYLGLSHHNREVGNYVVIKIQSDLSKFLLEHQLIQLLHLESSLLLSVEFELRDVAIPQTTGARFWRHPLVLVFLYQILIWIQLLSLLSQVYIR